MKTSSFSLLSVFLASFLLSFNAAAEPKPVPIFSTLTGNDFIGYCNKDAVSDQTSFLHFGLCLGYIKGLGDGLSILQLQPPRNFATICIPPNATIGQQKDVVMDYIQKNPSIRHEIISVLAISAWRSAWPCSE